MWDNRKAAPDHDIHHKQHDVPINKARTLFFTTVGVIFTIECVVFHPNRTTLEFELSVLKYEYILPIVLRSMPDEGLMSTDRPSEPGPPTGVVNDGDNDDEEEDDDEAPGSVGEPVSIAGTMGDVGDGAPDELEDLLSSTAEDTCDEEDLKCDDTEPEFKCGVGSAPYEEVDVFMGAVPLLPNEPPSPLSDGLVVVELVRWSASCPRPDIEPNSIKIK